MSLEMVPAKVGGDSGASNEPWATGREQSTQASTATLRAATTHRALSHWQSQWRYLPALYLLNPPIREGREGKGEKAEQQNSCCLKETAPHTAETTSYIIINVAKLHLATLI